MTQARASSIEIKVIYKHLDDIMRELENCTDSHVVFSVGRHLGMMQCDLREELEKKLQVCWMDKI